MDWKAVISKLREQDALKPLGLRNPWIGRISLGDLLEALEAGLTEPLDARGSGPELEQEEDQYLAETEAWLASVK